MASLILNILSLSLAVNQSGKFQGNQYKISKRGTRIGRRALYAVTLASIRRNPKAIPINKVLLNTIKLI